MGEGWKAWGIVYFVKPTQQGFQKIEGMCKMLLETFASMAEATAEYFNRGYTTIAYHPNGGCKIMQRNGHKVSITHVGMLTYEVREVLA